MRTAFGCAILAALFVTAVGCERKSTFDGPKVDQFTGKLVHDGRPVSFKDDENVQLKLFHEKGQSFGVPIKPDGTFEVGWMPIGKYSATLIRESGKQKGASASKYGVPEGMTVEDGKTDYTIELGKGWKP